MRPAEHARLIAGLQERLAARRDPATKDWWERYLRGVIEFRGVNMAGIRGAVHDWHAVEQLEPSHATDVALALVRQDLAEDKLAGILLMQEILLPAGALPWKATLPRVAQLFDDGAIFDWNTCDWLCVRVLGPLAAQQGERAARGIAGWRTAANLWRRRAAGFSFANLAPVGEENFAGFTAMLLDVCEATVQGTDRFAQTGTGWVLRELSRAEPAAVTAFVAGHLDHMSREAVRSATAKLDESVRRDLLARHRTSPR